MREHRQLLKSASIISTLTLISRVFGYIRDSRIAFLLGAGTAADAYVAAYRIPNLLRRLVGEGRCQRRIHSCLFSLPGGEEGEGCMGIRPAPC
jgi:peptidoglycan biosynthesis protein MviN/MurJ (putative lipid II flippase)